MAGLVDNIFGITARQYEEEKQQSLQSLAERLSSDRNIPAGEAMLGATIGDFLGTKLGVAFGGTDPRQEVRDNKAKMQALNASLAELGDNDPERFYQIAAAQQSVGNTQEATQSYLRGQQLERLNAATKQATADRAEVSAGKAKVLADKGALRSAFVAYSQDPTDENKEAVFMAGGTPASIASMNANDGDAPTPSEEKAVKLKMLQNSMRLNPYQTVGEALEGVNNNYNAIYNPSAVEEVEVVETGDADKVVNKGLTLEQIQSIGAPKAKPKTEPVDPTAFNPWNFMP